jgi:SAM-dependent methyltransferase
MKADQYWDSREAVAMYAHAPHLLRSEAAALTFCFPAGLSDKSFLDLGCGGGRTTAVLQARGARVIGVDASTALIDAARALFPQVDFRVGRAEVLTFADASFDCVLVAGNSLDYIDSKNARLQALREIRRVLRPNGWCVMSHHNMGAWLFKLPRWDALDHRLKHIFNGNILRSECFVLEDDLLTGTPGIVTYHAWPQRVIRDMHELGFDCAAVFANQGLLRAVQRLVRTALLTKLAENMPYYAFRLRPGAQ